MHYAFPSMRRRIIAALWIAGAMIPLLVGTVYLVGCCVLPFHAVMHELMPVCEMAVHAMRGEHDPAPTSVPEKQEPVKRIVTRVPDMFRLGAVATTQHTVTPTASTSYRSFITLGAIRCDRDVGLHALVQTFLI